jgi:glycosyltransferase involved in cell wall biosynthesis
VDTERYLPTGDARSEEWLVVSALTPYKRLEVAIQAARIAGAPLAVVGRGPEEARLRREAGDGVRFLGWRSDEQLRVLYSRARGLLFPGVEDFGIVPLEAMACGCPVVAYAEGGVRETVLGAAWEGDPTGWERDGTGLLVREQTPEAFARAIGAVSREPERFDAARCRRRAEEFARPVFRRRIAAALTSIGAGSIFPA